MTYRVVLHRKAVAEVNELPASSKSRVKAAIDALAHDPRPPEATKLKGQASAYRLRLGDYRLLYEVHATEVVVYVIGVAHRKEVCLRRVLVDERHHHFGRRSSSACAMPPAEFELVYYQSQEAPAAEAGLT